MKKRDISNILLLSILLAYIAIYLLFIRKHFFKYAESLSTAFIILLVFFGVLLLGWSRDKTSRLKKNVLRIALTQIIIVFSLQYAIGLFTGFLENSYSLSPLSILNNIFAPLFTIVAVEIFRYIVISANKDKNIIPILLTILLISFELSTTLGKINLADFAEIFRITSTIVLPVIIKNIVLTYLTLKVGYKTPIVYRLVMDLYIYILPLVPDLGDYISSMIGICLPVVIYAFSSRMITDYHQEEEYVKNQKKIRPLVDIPILIFVITFAYLVSGKFTYALIGVGSESMQPKINKGDAVFVKKIRKDTELKENDIIVFRNLKEKKVVIHRIKKIENVNGKIRFITRGDANNTNDKEKIDLKNIQGKVKFRIPYIAYPSVYITEALKKEKEE